MRDRLTKILGFVDKETEKYSDTFSLVMFVVGGMMASISLGTVSGGVVTNGYAAVYLKHPIYLHLGLAAIVFGFVNQFADNLTTTHKLTGRGVSWLVRITFISLIILALFN